MPIRRFCLLALLLVSATVGMTAGVTEIPTPAAAGSTAPFLSRDGGAILLSWLEPAKNGRVALRVARLENGKWAEPRSVVERSDLFVNWADIPSVVADGHGVLFAHWLQKNGKDSYAYDVRMATSADRGATWTAPFLLNRDGRHVEHGFVSFVPLPGGGVGAAWLDGRNMTEGKEEGEMSLRYATVDRRGALHGESVLDTRTCECCATGMALTGGGAVVVYRDRSAAEVRDIAFVRQVGGGWSKPQLVHADGWKIAGCPVNGPQIDAAGAAAAVAWFTGADQPRAFIAFSQDGGKSFGAPIRIDDGQPVGRVDVVMLDAATAVVSWLERTAAGAEIRARSVLTGGATAPSIKVADAAAGRAAGFTRIVRSGRDVYFAWTEQTAAGSRVHVARGRW